MTRPSMVVTLRGHHVTTKQFSKYLSEQKISPSNVSGACCITSHSRKSESDVCCDDLVLIAQTLLQLLQTIVEDKNYSVASRPSSLHTDEGQIAA